jgi:hypothetical protein
MHAFVSALASRLREARMLMPAGQVWELRITEVSPDAIYAVLVMWRETVMSYLIGLPGLVTSCCWCGRWSLLHKHCVIFLCAF